MAQSSPAVLGPFESSVRPVAYARISTIGNLLHGLFEPAPDGGEPCVELRSERMIPLIELSKLTAERERADKATAAALRAGMTICDGCGEWHTKLGAQICGA